MYNANLYQIKSNYFAWVLVRLILLFTIANIKLDNDKDHNIILYQCSISMKTEDEYPHFLKNLQKFINDHFLNPQTNRSESWKAPKQVDQVLEEEYETLLNEIDYLTGGKSCYLNFKNERYRNVSSDEIIKTLSKHSWKVLENYLKQNTRQKSFDSRKDIVNYITEIVVSGPKCNNKLCSCKPLKTSKQTNAENNDISINGKKVETTNQVNEKGIIAVPNTTTKLNQISEELLLPKRSVVNAVVQTDDYLHNTNCTCGKCPLLNTTTPKKLSNTEKDIEPEKDTYPNCLGILINELNKVCVPKEIELFCDQLNDNTIPICTSTKQDCSCDVFEIKEAPKRGLISSTSDIGISKKVSEKNEKGNKKRSKKRKTRSSSTESTTKLESDTSEDEHLRSDNNISESSSKKGNKKKKKKTGKKSDSDAKVRKKKLKSKNQPIGCFVRIRKRKADEESQNIFGNQRSIQTLPIRTQDQKEQACHCTHNGTKAVKLSTNSEVAIQVSASSLRVNIPKNIKPCKYAFAPDINRFEDAQKKCEYCNEYGINDDPKNVMRCNKCGRKKVDCTTGCRNTIVFPVTGSNKSLSTGEAESLRMVIKMQSKDTNRQLDSILSELTYQKNELRRLNEAYHLMKENISEIKRSDYCPAEQKFKSFNNTKPCGCVTKECRDLNNSNQTTNEKSYNSTQGKRFGPPNTSVVINLCEFCDSGEAGDTIAKATCLSSESCEEKRRKYILNKSKKLGITQSNDAAKQKVNMPESKSVSTIYQKKNEFTNKKIEDSSSFEHIPKSKNTQENNSSKILLWLKRSWISIKHKSNECKTKMQEKRKKQQKESKCKTKNIFTGIWKMARKTKL